MSLINKQIQNTKIVSLKLVEHINTFTSLPTFIILINISEKQISDLIKDNKLLKTKILLCS